MVIYNVREQVEAGLMEIQKVKGEFSNANTMTKKVRDHTFKSKAKHIMSGK